MPLTLSPTHSPCPAVNLPLTGSEVMFLVQGGVWRRTTARQVVSQLAPQPLLPLDVKTTVGTKFTFTTPYRTPPRWIPIPTWTANGQIVVPTLTEITATSITMGAMVSQSVLGLQLTPVYVKAPSGTNVQCLLLGN